MKIQTSFKLDEDLIKKLKLIAEEEHRSFSNLVEMILTRYVETITECNIKG